MKKTPATAVVLEKRLGRLLSGEAQRTGLRAVGLSGGRDSVVLAEALWREGIAFEAWHFNHGWRGAESDADAAWVRAWCRERSVPLRTGKARAGGRKSEGQAREQRWDFFLKEAGRRGVGELWLAHHADDRAETLLLQLLRGAGPEGLSGTRAERRRGVLSIKRPLVVFRRAELALLARHWKLEWREDPSNADVRHRRNAVRHRLLPYLDRVAGRSVAPLLARSAEIFEEENAYWESILPAEVRSRLSVKELQSRAVAWQRRLIRKWLLGQGVSEVGFQEIEAVRGLVHAVKPARVNLAGGCFCRRTRGELWLER